MFNSDINVNNRWVCDITVVIDLTEGNARSKLLTEKDGYDVIESLCKSKLVLVNDINSVAISSTKNFKPYIKMYFDYSDSVKSKGGIIHYDGSDVVYGFDTDKQFTGSNRSAEHLHSEPLEYVGGKWKLISGYVSIDKNIIWKDDYRGYNNTKIFDDSGTIIKSDMELYPVDNKNDLTDTSAMEYDPYSTTANSGFGYCRGPLTYIYAGNKGEYTFNHVKTFFDPSGIVYPETETGDPLFTCSKCNDVIYCEAKYYVISSQF